MLSKYPQLQQNILGLVKKKMSLGRSELAKRLKVSAEAVRQALAALQEAGLLLPSEPKRSGKSGRPGRAWRLSPAGEELFPKDYAALSVELIDAVGRTLGPKAAQAVLSDVVSRKVEAWKPRLKGMNGRARAEALKSFYSADDSYMNVEEAEGGRFLLRERNCPYLQVAQKRPLLCSTTVSVLSQLFGCEVERVQRFQNGDGCCAFLVKPDKPRAKDLPMFQQEAGLPETQNFPA